LFNLQGLNYRQTILDNKPTVSIELASTAPWYKYADLTIGVDDFGKSGKPQDVINFFDLTPEKIANKIITWLKPKG
jgi:transketolase